MRRHGRHTSAARDTKNQAQPEEPPIKLSRVGHVSNEISYDIVEWWPNGDKECLLIHDF